MRLESALYSSKEGLNSHGVAISVVGDNISNVSTVGYKSSRVEFADVVAGSGATTSSALEEGGSGSRVGHIRQVHELGVIEFTGRGLDVGIAGKGFFMAGETTAPVYTRAGNFALSEDGLLVTADGLSVLGFQGTGTTLGELDLKNVAVAGSATTAISVYGNVASDAGTTTVANNPESFKALGALASFQTNVQALDSLGSSHDVTLAFFKTGSNAWTAQAYIDGGEVGGTEGVPSKLGDDLSITFQGNGIIAEDDLENMKLTLAPAYSNGADAGNFTVDLSNFTQFAGSSGIRTINADGVGAGEVKSYEIQTDGTILALLSSGSRATVGTIQLASFTNIDGLDRQGNNNFSAGDTVGEITTGSPGQEGLGKLEPSSLERSTVDIASQFIDLVLYQRGYQANSQTLNATNDLIRGTIQLIR